MNGCRERVGRRRMLDERGAKAPETFRTIDSPESDTVVLDSDGAFNWECTVSPRILKRNLRGR